jgi:hypothetical protein
LSRRDTQADEKHCKVVEVIDVDLFHWYLLSKSRGYETSIVEMIAWV